VQEIQPTETAADAAPQKEEHPMKRIPTLATVAVALTLFAFAATTFAQAAPAAPPASDQVQAPKAPKAPPKATRVAKPAFEGKININGATAKEIEKLPKVGPKLAQRIVEYREQHKGFRSVEELRNVKGIGAKMLETLRPHLTL
jgi:comEA protein